MQNEFLCMLSIPGTYFIAGWAYGEIFLLPCKRGVNFMMFDRPPPWEDSSTVGETLLQRGRLIFRGGDSSTDGWDDSFTDGGVDSSTDWRGELSTEGEICLRRGSLFYGGVDSSSLIMEQYCEKCPLVSESLKVVRSCILWLKPLKLSVQVILWYKNVTSCLLMIYSIPSLIRWSTDQLTTDSMHSSETGDMDGRQSTKTWERQWWAKLLRLLTVNSLSYFVKIKY